MPYGYGYGWGGGTPPVGTGGGGVTTGEFTSRGDRVKQPKPWWQTFGPGWVGGLPVAFGGNGNGKRRGSGLPLDAQGRIDLSTIAQQRLNFMDQYNTQLGDINRNYAIQQQRAAQDEPYAQRGIISDFAGRGMAHSSGYGVAAGRETQMYNRNMADLSYAHTLGLQQLHDSRHAMRRTAHMQNQAVRQAAADRLAAQAGTLGLAHGNWSNKRIRRVLGVLHGGHGGNH